MVRRFFPSTLILGTWVLAAALMASAQSAPVLLTDALISLADLPEGYRGAGPADDAFPAFEKVEVRALAYERDPDGVASPSGPSRLVSALAWSNDVDVAAEAYRLTVQDALARGWVEQPVPLLGDEATGLASSGDGSTDVSQRYLFRNRLTIVAVTITGPAGGVSLEQSVGFAVTVSARLDHAIAAMAPQFATLPTSSSVPTAATPARSTPVASTPTPAAPARTPVTVPTIASEATLDDPPVIVGDVRLGGFSGIQAMDASGRRFAVLTDRGPNVFFRSRNEAVFAAPSFTPSIVILALEGDLLRIVQTIPLRLPEGYTNPATGGREITGISTGSHDGPGYTVNHQLIPYDPNGVDSEGLAKDPRDGSFWIADEYAPSILHVAADGTVLTRLVPQGLGLDAPGENIREILPAVLLKRKPNRGFEGVAISPDGSRLYALMQTALYNPDRRTGEDSRHLRLVALDTSRPEPSVIGMYLYQAEPYSSVGAGNQDDIKIGDLAAVSSTRLVVAERDSQEGGRHKMAYLIDVANATDVLNKESISGKTIEQASDADLKRAIIEPVAKEPLVDLARLGFRTEKFEGLAIVDDTTLALTGDNDFGLEEVDKDGRLSLTQKPSSITIVRLPKPIR